MVKRIFFFVLLMVLSLTQASAQPGNPCDPATVNQLQNDLIAQGFDCLEGAGPFACIDDVFNYAFENCAPPIDTTGNNCDPVVVAQVQTDLISQGFSCLVNAGPFACVDDVVNYALENCPPNGGGGGNPCDSAIVAQTQAALISQGFDCLIGAGPFACVDEVFNYAFENCAPPIDTSGCDSNLVWQVQADMIAQGFDCLIGAGPFTCVYEVYDYAFANCSPGIDTTGGDPCDPVVVNQCQQDLIAQGFDCLVNAGPFNCLDELFNYALQNCPPPVDSNACDPVLVAQVQSDLIGQGFNCLVNAGPFACVEEVLQYAFDNCPPPIDTTGGNECDSISVQQTIDDMLAQGYDCLLNAGPFYCVHEVICYALVNCPQYVDTTFTLPICLQNLPDSVNTFQQTVQYIAANCDSTEISVPACWLTAPQFQTDDEFIQWITINCDYDSLYSGNMSGVTNYFFSTQGSVGVNQPEIAFEMEISPNPTSAIINISMKEGDISRVELYDVTGRQCMVKSEVAASKTTLSLAHVPAGIYLARVQNSEGAVVTRRIVKE